jgi:glycosyltransferase involved in cell wall biosynthesis
VYEGEAGSGPSLYVANGVDEQEFAPLPLRDCRQKLDLPQDALLVGYFGSMEADRGVADLLQALTLLRGEGVPLQLLLCGRAGPGLDLTQDGVLFRGMVPHADMPCYLNACDVLAIPYRESAIMDMGASCKIAEYLMCVRPLVSTRTANFIANFPEQARELGAALCPALDPAALAAAIRQQLARPQLVSRPEHLAWGHIAADALDAIGKIAAPVPTA